MLRLFGGAAFFLAAWLMAATSAVANQKTQERPLLGSFQTFIVGGQATRLHIDYLPYEITTFIPVEPWTLARDAWVKCDIALKGAVQTELLSILPNVRGVVTEEPHDVRWGLTLYSQSNREIMSLFLGRTYSNTNRTDAWMEGSWLSIDRQLVEWLETNIDIRHLSAVDCWMRPGVTNLLEAPH